MIINVICIYIYICVYAFTYVYMYICILDEIELHSRETPGLHQVPHSVGPSGPPVLLRSQAWQNHEKRLDFFGCLIVYRYIYYREINGYLKLKR